MSGLFQYLIKGVIIQPNILLENLQLLKHPLFQKYVEIKCKNLLVEDTHVKLKD